MPSKAILKTKIAAAPERSTTMRLRLNATSLVTLLLLMFALAPMLLARQVQRNNSDDDNRSAAKPVVGGTDVNPVTKNDPGNPISQLFPALPPSPLADDDKALCWKQTYTRGVGTVPTADCGAGNEKDAGLCYPKCRAGYKGVGPVCWQSCPDKFRDDGAFCAKPEAYG